MVNPVRTIVVLLAVMLFIAGCTSDDASQDIPEPEPQDLSRVVATVNGEQVTEGDVVEIQQLFFMYGQQVSMDDALDQIITEMVLEQRAYADGFAVSREEVEEELVAQLVLQGLTLDDFREMIEMEGITYDVQIAEYQKQLTIQAYIDSVLAQIDFAITDEQVRSLYDEYAAQSDDIPPFVEVEEEIRVSMRAELEQEAVMVLIDELKTQADLVRY